MERIIFHNLPDSLSIPLGVSSFADSTNRVVVYAPPFVIGQSIARIIGVVTTANAPAVSESTLGAAQSVFFVGNDPYVVDTGNSRILEYDPFDQWPPEATLFSPRATSVIGQPNFQSGSSNAGLPQPGASTLAGAVSAVFDGTDLLVVDSGNNRVLAFPRQGNGSFIAASRVLGQLDFQYTALNLIDGRELGLNGNVGSCGVNGALPFFLGGSVAIDAPHLYVADPLNNRILGYLDYRKVNAGMKADLVIGQPDLLTSLVNYPSNSPTQASAQGLWSPEGLAVDAQGNLYVADACNGRVVRFPAPFEQTSGVVAHADLALGQASLFGQPIKDAGSQTMKSAYGLAFTAAGDLLVSDPLANRILYFKKTATGDFQTGQAATNVFGQPNFSSTIGAVFAGPHLIATDANDQLYVADTGNNRIAALPSVPTAGDNPPVLFAIPQLSSPYGVAVNQATGEIWALNTGGNQVLRYANSAAVIPTPPLVRHSASLVQLHWRSIRSAIRLWPRAGPIALRSTIRRSTTRPPPEECQGVLLVTPPTSSDGLLQGCWLASSRSLRHHSVARLHRHRAFRFPPSLAMCA
jgi:DNA-binding beta-propeller fold protein YncE